MRILHITPAFRPAIGGIESVVAATCDTLCGLGHVSDVAHVQPQQATATEKIGGFKVYRVPLLGHRFAGLAPGLRELASAYDLLHVHDPQLLSITASVMAFGSGRPAVLSTHGGFRHTRKFGAIKSLHEMSLMRWMLRRYRKVLASSTSDRDYFAMYADNVALAENGVDTRRFASIRPAPERTPFRWIYWGRLASHKRVDLLLDLAAAAQAADYPVELFICGEDFDGSLARLQEKQARLAVKNVHIRPKLRDAELDQLISTCGLFVTASEYEGFGLTIIEAMAAGLPVIARRMAPIIDFVAGENGLLLNFDDSPGDKSMLASFLARLKDHHGLMTKICRNRAAEYGWPIRIAPFLSAYEEVLSAASRANCD